MRTFFRRQTCWLPLFLAAGLCTGSARAGNVVNINSDQVLVINGRKVFPIGFTLGPPPAGKTPSGKSGLQELAEAGGTFIRTGPTRTNWNKATLAAETEWEDAAARSGLYCWLYLRDLASIGPRDQKKEAFLREVVNRFKDHPGLGIWKGEDEPQWGKAKIPPMLRARDVVRELDTNHPIAIIEAPRGTVEELQVYNAAGDITGADIYPISYPPGTDSLLANKEISMVGDYTRKMVEVSQGRMPVWMVLQIAWSGVVKPGKTLRFPTFPEERFMTYEAIINGARGLVYFGGNVTQAMSPEDAALGWNWTFWKRVLRPVIEEVGNHSPLAAALVAPDAKTLITVRNGPGIEFCAREVGADFYLLACQRDRATAQVQFENVPMPDGKVELMYESPRQVRVVRGTFSDWFAPFEVHVYHGQWSRPHAVKN